MTSRWFEDPGGALAKAGLLATEEPGRTVPVPRDVQAEFWLPAPAGPGRHAWKWRCECGQAGSGLAGTGPAAQAMAGRGWRSHRSSCPRRRTPMRRVGPSLYDLRQAWLDGGTVTSLLAFHAALAKVQSEAELDVLGDPPIWMQAEPLRPAHPRMGFACLLAIVVACAWLRGSGGGVVVDVAAGLALLAFRPTRLRGGSVETPGEREEQS